VTVAARLLAVLLLAALAAGLPAGAARAQPPDGIVRPADERGLSPRELGSQLYAGNCVSCHGIDGRGVTAGSAGRGAGDIAGQGPPLRGVGALAADFYLRTGYMPLGSPDEEPTHSRSLFTEREIRALVSYVASLGGGPAIPRPEPQKGSLSEGLELFTEHCAGCHQVVAQGGYVTDSRVPPLEDATARQVAQAVRIGPYLMPKFSKKDITDAELNSIVRYVLRSKHPTDRGGWGIGNLGPFPEGIVTWFLAVVALVVTCMAIGKRLRA
jgi:ubiquinol-cytochrome c reductase cytochrome c subunit